MAGVDYIAIRDAILTKVNQTGQFVAVYDHDPLAAPQEQGVVAAMIGMSLSTSQLSGMASVTMRLEIVIRVMLDGMAKPEGLIDFGVFTAADQVMGALIGDVRLGALAGVRNIDVLGEGGDQLRMVAGWTDIAQTKFRIADVYIPILINDVWDFG